MNLKAFPDLPAMQGSLDTVQSDNLPAGHSALHVMLRQNEVRLWVAALIVVGGPSMTVPVRKPAVSRMVGVSSAGSVCLPGGSGRRNSPRREVRLKNSSAGFITLYIGKLPAVLYCQLLRPGR